MCLPPAIYLKCLPFSHLYFKLFVYLFFCSKVLCSRYYLPIKYISHIMESKSISYFYILSNIFWKANIGNFNKAYFFLTLGWLFLKKESVKQKHKMKNFNVFIDLSVEGDCFLFIKTVFSPESFVRDFIFIKISLCTHHLYYPTPYPEFLNPLPGSSLLRTPDLLIHNLLDLQEDCLS